MPASNSTIGGIDIALWKNAGLTICFVIFSGILLRLMLSGRSRYDAAARIPLEHDGSVAPEAPSAQVEKEESKHG